MTAIDQTFLGTQQSIIKNDDSCVAHYHNETGKGIISSYEIMDGIYFMLCDFRMKSMARDFRYKSDLFCFDFCLEGRGEYTFPGGHSLCMQEGDLNIDSRKHNSITYYSPLNHFQTVSISFVLPNAQKSIQETFRGFPVDFERLKEKYTSKAYPYIIRKNEAIRGLFQNLNNPGIDNWKAYLKIKILEIILYLDSVDIDLLELNNNYYLKSQVNKINRMHELMINDLEHHYTLEALSRKFDIPLTPMNKCFKEIYGKAIYTYMRELRMSRAARMLLQGNVSIAEAAMSVGYSNPSKFSSAFKKIMGMLPNDYRRTKGGVLYTQ